MQRIVLALSILLAALVTQEACALTPISATYERINNTFQGTQLQYAVLELDFGEPVFYTDNGACGCLNGCAACASKVPVNQTDLWPSVPSWPSDTWYEVARSPSTATQYFKFFLDPAKYATVCPIVVIEYQSDYGENSLVVGVNRAPGSVDYDFIHNAWTRPALWLCPQHASYAFGWYYLQSIVASPQVPWTAYLWRWSTITPDACPVSTPAVPLAYQPGPTATWTLLYDNIPSIQNVTTPMQYYRFYVDAACADVVISARSISGSQFGAPGFGDPNLMVSWTVPEIDLQYASRIDYHSATEWDDWLALRGLCHPNGTAPMVLYIVTDNWLALPWYEQMVVAAASSQTFVSRPVAEIGPNSFTTTFANDFGRLECGGVRGEWREHLRSVYPAYMGGCDQQDPWGCQMYFVPIASGEDPELRATHFFPDSKSNPHTYFLRDLPWPAFANASINHPNRMRFVLWLSTQQGDVYTQYIHQPLESCELRWNGNLVDAAGSPLVGYTALTPRALVCDPTQWDELRVRLTDRVARMQTETDLDTLLMLHAETQGIVSSRAWRACKARMQDYVDLASASVTFPAQLACTDILDSDAFRANPCCMWRATVGACCVPQDVNTSLTLPARARTELVDAVCGVPECATIPLQQYVTSYDDNVCAQNWVERASPAVLAARTAFVQDCRVQVYGPDQQGVACTQDADCMSTCDRSRARCNDGDLEVVQCWGRNMDALTARYLFNYWNITDPFSATRFVQEVMDRHTSLTCVGPTGLHYRDHWQYYSIYTGCQDACIDASNGIDLEPRCFEVNSSLCPIPPKCLYTIGINSCWRVWYFLPGDLNQCESTTRCSWLDCVDSGLPGDTCRANCTAFPSGGSNNNNMACVVCDGDHCTEVAGNLTQAQCLQPNRTLPGSCDRMCGPATACRTQSECEAMGECLNQDDDPAVDTWTSPSSGFAYYNRSGLCFTPFLGNYYGGLACGGNADYDLRLDQLANPFMRFGCVCDNASLASRTDCDRATTEAQCQQRGYLWVNATLSRAQCTSALVPQRCYESDKASNLATLGAFTGKSLSDCQRCGWDYAPVLRWQPGVWTPARNVTYQWVQRGMVPINRRQRGLDFIGFADALEKAAFATAALAYSSELLCRYGAEGAAIAAVTCDCGDAAASGGRACYSVQPRLLVADRVCPYIESTIAITEVRVMFANTSVPPAAFCQPVRLYTTGAETYAVTPRLKLSSEIFYPQQRNPYVVPSSAGAVQIQSDAIQITWEADLAFEPFELCISPRRDLATGNAGVWAIGMVQASVPIEVVTTDVRLASDGLVCGSVTARGQYVLVRTVTTSSVESSGTRAMAYVAAVLYLVLVVATMAQSVRFVAATHGDKCRNPVSIAKVVALGATGVFTLTRGIFFFLSPSTLEEQPFASLMLFEVPGVLLFVMYTSFVYIGTHVVYRLKTLEASDRFTGKDKTIMSVVVAITAFVLLVFVCFVALFYLIEEPPTLPCKLQDKTLKRHQTVNLTYLAFLGAISLILGATVCVVASMFARVIHASLQQSRALAHESQRRGKKLVLNMMILIVISYPVLFFLRTCLLATAMFNPDVTVPLLAFALIECFPATVLLFYIQPVLLRSSVLTSTSEDRTTPSTTPHGSTVIISTEAKTHSSKTPSTLEPDSISETE